MNSTRPRYTPPNYPINAIQDCEEKLADKDEKIRQLRHENTNVNNAGCGQRDGRGMKGGDCRIVGAMKETVEELTEELR